MRIVTWNCRGGFHRKTEALLGLHPDVAIVQECAPPSKWMHTCRGWHAIWHGADSPIGVGILAPEGSALSLGAPLTNEIRCFLPAHVQAAASFGILGCWTKQGRPGQRSYVGQLALALDEYADFLASQPCLVVGDLNSNAIWDRGKPWQHLAVTERLRMLRLVSIYHHFFREEHGYERLPTYRHNTGQPFHLDYCFLPEAWLNHVRTVSVGEDEWLRLSDHRPLVVDIDL